MKLSFIKLSIVFICMLSSALMAKNTNNIVEIPMLQQKVFIPSSSVLVLKDPSNEKTLKQVIADSLQFESLSKDMIFLSDEAEFFWVKVQLTGKALSKDRWLFEIPDSHLGSVTAFMSVDGRPTVYLEAAGYDHKFSKRKYQHKNIIFPIDNINVNNGGVVTIYLKYESKFRNVLFYKLSKVNTFLSYSNTEYLLLGLYYGILICLILSSILLYFSIGEKTLIYLIGFLLTSILVGLTEDNLGSQYLFVNQPELNYLLMKYASTLSMLSIVLLSTHFLKMREKYFNAYISIWAVTIVNALYFLIFKGINVSIWSLPTFLIPFIIIFIYLLKDIKKEETKITYFLIGYVVILSGLTLQVLRVYGIFISDNIIVVYAFNLGLLLTGLFMTLSQFEKFKVLKEEKEKVQLQLIEDLKVREKVIEDKVVERTNEIAKQKEVIDVKNKELEWVNDELNKQRLQIQSLNKKLTVENEQLIEDVGHLETARVLMQEVTFEEFEKMFPSDEMCYNYLEEIKWKEGFTCKKCGGTDYAKGTGVNSRRCKKCNYNESVTSGTLFHRLHFPIQKAFYMVFIVFSKDGDISSTKLSEILEMRQNTCWKFSKKIKESIELKKEVLGSEDLLKQKGWEELILN
ncbi:hypothetical protein EI427_03815 [Flammeovirga pectinis]|uniref:Chromosome partitioning protein ParA n=1 Tax=Flammeovirga pectinis TaxID=2494373 RepID=A0A3Q9FM49_9BACT|nr:7TM diverse intracellular signaling domain-containing protein [Flammeovirga pectinis]AZQ61379.1 hypothetical protein EI427_03815 [Flammeovirga pectinis]